MPPPLPPAPPSSSLPPLAPAKRDAHAQFTYHGRSLEEIAAARRGIRVGTVGSYLAEAVAAGACVCACGDVGDDGMGPLCVIYCPFFNHPH